MVVADVNQYSTFVPWCVESKVTKTYNAQPTAQPLEQQFDAELAVGFKMFVERYSSRVVVVPGTSVTATSSNTSVFQHLQTHWVFKHVDNNPNAVDIVFNIEFEFKSKIYSTASAQFLDEVVGEMVGAFEQQCSRVKHAAPTVEMKNDTLLSTKEWNAVSERFNVITLSHGSGVMSLPQFKKMYYDLFVHSSSETIEEEKRQGGEEGGDTENNIALVIKMGELMTRTVTEKDLDHLAERHFHVMDNDASGTLDKNEFIAGMAILLNGTIEQQWEHSFKIFDHDSDGYITEENLMQMFNATSNVQSKMLLELLIYTRDQLVVNGDHDVAKQFQIDIDQLEKEDTTVDNGKAAQERREEYPLAVQELVRDIFEEVDLDKDNLISFEEFCLSQMMLEEVQRLSAHKISFFDPNCHKSTKSPT